MSIIAAVAEMLAQMSRYEMFAALFGVVSVYLSARENVWSWPMGIVNVALYIVVFRDAKLYADMVLQGVYLVLSFYGWYQWLYGGRGHTELPVSRIARRTTAMLVVLCVVGSLALGAFLARHTDAALPYLDSALTVTSLAAQWLLTRKVLENWLVWIAVDIVYVPLFLYKQLYPTAALYAVFLLLAVTGYLGWRRHWMAAR